VIARLVLYHLSHAPSPFALAIFWIRFNFYADWPAWSSYLWFLCYWDDRHVPPKLAYLLRWGLTNFLPGWNTLDLHLPSSKDYKH
jgi:hypothetical protein